MIPKVASWKEGRVAELKEIISSPGVVGIIDIGGVPAKNMLDMRSSLKGIVSMTMAKKTLMRIAWKEAGRSTEELEVLFEGAAQPCIVHSDSLNAYQLFDELKKTRQGRAAKEGELAPSDIIVPAGPTEFAPGPLVGEFNAVGIPAKIDKGKIAIQKETKVVSAGEPMSADLGMMLAKLGINPIEIGLILIGAIEEGLLLPADDLDLDLDGLKDDISIATSRAFNLACNAHWFSTATTPVLLAKASSESLAVAVEAGIVNDKTAELFVMRANARMMALASQLDSSALDEGLTAALGAVSSAVVVASETTESDAGTPATEEEEEEEEETGFGGLGDLFG
ncbi:MAG: 50S ribosomal protein L10 [Euryarchaeota archaeon TMED129]|uniref:Large ribosomal subunit protein uL10 n=1 Tax=uncultured Poseidoniia archaeon TaxID=1697135 RepID=A0A1B1TFF3_9ARCH|nr:ribosomal protein P0 RplPO (RP-L10, rplJ) [uncultured Candidatus Thalassoarchaea sp.]OUV66155.1 MAG: 50S ribosomal protein L10 [Euryarchaeota archaeon TMED129]